MQQDSTGWDYVQIALVPNKVIISCVRMLKTAIIGKLLCLQCLSFWRYDSFFVKVDVKNISMETHCDVFVSYVIGDNESVKNEISHWNDFGKLPKEINNPNRCYGYDMWESSLNWYSTSGYFYVCPHIHVCMCMMHASPPEGCRKTPASSHPLTD